MINSSKPRVIAFYLPQFHPIPENDNWWGKGFTEWTNVGKAKALFRGHKQPKVPADLGYYDLRLPEVRQAQADMASNAGIEGFCYWHYWFGNGKQLLERPFSEVLRTGKPNFPFCLAWANHTWSRSSWSNNISNSQDNILIEQTYPGEEEHALHFYSILDAFKDNRYITINEEPIFLIYDPLAIPDTSSFIKQWKKLAIENGLKGIHFIGITQNLTGFHYKNNKKCYSIPEIDKASSINYKKVLDLGYDAVNSRGIFRAEVMTKTKTKITTLYAINKLLNFPILDKYEYKKIIKHLYVKEDAWLNVYPTIIPNWDRSPRSGNKSRIWYGSTPKLFGESISNCLDIIKHKNQQNKIIFLMSWNEWAEGNYIEPDLEFGQLYLLELKKRIESCA